MYPKLDKDDGDGCQKHLKGVSPHVVVINVWHFKIKNSILEPQPAMCIHVRRLGLVRK